MNVAGVETAQPHLSWEKAVDLMPKTEKLRNNSINTFRDTKVNTKKNEPKEMKAVSRECEMTPAEDLRGSRNCCFFPRSLIL